MLGFSKGFVISIATLFLNSVALTIIPRDSKILAIWIIISVITMICALSAALIRDGKVITQATLALFGSIVVWSSVLYLIYFSESVVSTIDDDVMQYAAVCGAVIILGSAFMSSRSHDDTK